MQTITQTPSNQLRATDIISDFDIPIPANKNLLYCATFRLAWNKLINDILKAPLELEGSDIIQDKPDTLEKKDKNWDDDFPWLKPATYMFIEEEPETPQKIPLVDQLNKPLISAGDIEPDSYLAMVGYRREGIVQQIEQAMETKFGVKPTLESSLGPADSLVAYAYLQKKLPFDIPFEKFSKPIQFSDGQAVSAFGIKQRTDAMRQVGIISYQGPDEFIIKLQADEWVSMDVEFGLEVDYPRISEDDEIILAKIAPRSTLQATLQAVQSAINKQWSYPNNLPRVDPGQNDILSIPEIAFNVLHRYDELIGKRWCNPGFEGHSIGEALQTIQFTLNEQGAEVRSESQIEAVLGQLEESRHFIFDKPFLLMLRHLEAEHPYLLAWIQNSELLVKA